MVLGGVIVQPNSLPTVVDAIKKIREKHAILGEFKWGKVSSAKLPAYLELANILHDLRDHVYYKCLIVDNTKINLKKFHGGSASLAFDKFYWNLLYFKFCCALKTSFDTMVVVVDEGQSDYSLNELRRILNKKLLTNRGLGNSVRSIEAGRSHDHELIQLVDVITGAVQYHAHGYDMLSGASLSRVALASEICKVARVSRLCEETPYSRYRFEVWPLRLRS